MRFIAAPLLVSGLIALSGCAGMSESQCLASDWRTIGYRDGLNGTQSTALLRHQNACIKHDVRPDREAYLAGWREGVHQYCDPSNAFNVGERGAAYGNVCPPEMQEGFNSAYQEGRRLYLAQSELNQIHRAISEREQRLKDVKSELAAIAGYMIDSGATPGERAEMLLNAKDLAQEQGRLEGEIEDLKAEAAVKAERLENLRHNIAMTAY